MRKGSHHTEESKKKMSKARKGKKLSRETIDKIIMIRKNNLKEKKSKRISKKNKERYKKYPYLKKQISDKLKGIKWTDERRKEFSGRNNPRWDETTHIYKKCLNCGKTFMVYKSRKNAKFCSMDCLKNIIKNMALHRIFAV